MAVSQVAEMINVCVGEKPKPIYKSTVIEFNEIFLKMFTAFNENPKNRLVFSHFHDTGETGPFRSGELSVRWVWKLLAYHQLVHVEQKKEPTGEVSEKTGKPKMRTLNIITPTKLGYDAIERGQLLEAELRWDQRTISIGIGKPYPTFDMLWGTCDSMFTSARIAKTRKEKWLYEFRKTYPEIAGKIVDEAHPITVEWARGKIATAPRRRFKQTIKNNGLLEQDKNHKLEKWLQ